MQVTNTKLISSGLQNNLLYSLNYLAYPSMYVYTYHYSKEKLSFLNNDN